MIIVVTISLCSTYLFCPFIAQSMVLYSKNEGVSVRGSQAEIDTKETTEEEGRGRGIKYSNEYAIISCNKYLVKLKQVKEQLGGNLKDLMKNGCL